MKAIIQRAYDARVLVNNKEISAISRGLVVFLGIKKDDTMLDAQILLEKIVNLRIFENQFGKMDFSVLNIKGELLIIPQFTVYGDCEKGRRPDFTSAELPLKAKNIYDSFLKLAEKTGLKVFCGVFGEHMKVEVKNDGPGTFIVEAKK